MAWKKVNMSGARYKTPKPKTLIQRQEEAATPVDLSHLYDKPKQPSFVSKILSGFAKFANTPITQAQLKAPLAPVQTKNTILSNLQNKFNNSDYLKKVNAATAADIAGIEKNKQANIFKDQSENAKIKNPIAKFLARTSQSAGNMATLGNGHAEVDTGNKTANFISDTLGSIGGAMVNPLGAGETLYSGATKFVGNPIEKALAKKIGTQTALKRFGTGVAGSAGTMSAINAGLAAPQAKSIKDVGKAALTGAAQGALFGGVLHGAKEGNLAANKSISKSLDNIVGNADLGTGSKSISRYTPKTNNVIPMIAKPTALNSDTLKQGNTKVPTNNLSPLKTSNTQVNSTPISRKFNEYVGNSQEIPDEINYNGYESAKKTYVSDFLANNNKTIEETPENIKEANNSFDQKFSALNPDKTTYSNASIKKPSVNSNGIEITPEEIKQQQRQEVAAEPLKSGEVPTKLSMNVVSGDKGKKFSLKKGYNSFYTHVVDKNKAISDFSKSANKQGGNSETYMKATNAANVSTRVNRIMDQGLTDKQGNPIDISYKQLVKSMPQDKQSFTNYLLQNHNIDRSVEGKAIDSNYSASQSHQAVMKILQDHPEYKAKGKEFTGWINKFMGEYGNKSGLISNDLWKNLNDTYKNYLPTNRDFTDIEGVSPATNGKGFVGQSIPLKKLSTNSSSRDIVDPYTSVMNTINRTVRGATNNDVAQSMLKDIQANPQGMKKWGEVIPEGQKVNPNVNNVVTILDKGKKVNVQINDINLLKSLEGFQKGGDHPYQNILKKATQPYKDLITTKNPLFAVGNTTRDFVTAYVNGSVHNPIKYIKNYISAGKDLTTNSPIAQQYRALGGGGSNFDYNSSKATASLKQLTKKTGIIKRAIMKPLNGIEATNNVFESIPRLAEFKATIKKGGSLDQASYNSAEVSTNFSRGGNLTKAMDSGVPYLNASVQGLDKSVRQFIAHPIGTTAKGIISVTIPTIAINNLNKDNPHYQEMDNRTKDTYFSFPNPWGPKDANGYAETFIKLPKAREIGVLFGSLAERIIRQNNGETNAFKGFAGTALTNFAPANPLQNNLFSPLETYLPSNKDFAGRTIVPQSLQTRSPQFQYDETTSEIGKKLGALTGFSPKKIDYILKSYLGVIGQIGLPAATKQTYTGNTQGNLLKPILTKFTADPLYSNQDVTDFYDNLDKATKAAADNNFTNNVDSATVTDQEYAKSALLKNATKMSDLVKAATAAAESGDNTKARSLRQQMVDLAKSSNADIGQEPNQKIMDTITNTLKDPNGALDASGNVKSNNGDEAKALRQKVTALKDQSKNSTISDVDMRSQLNDLLSQAQNTSMPTTEFTTAISDTLKYNTSKEATAIRAKVTQITHSNLSVKEQRDILQGVVDEAKNAPVKHAKPRKKKDTLNPFNKY